MNPVDALAKFLPPGRQLVSALVAALVLAAIPLFPSVVSPYQAYLLSTGLTYAIAGLGFNLLLGYTGLLSFGHAAYFGMGAYAVAFLVKWFGVNSMEAFLVAGVLAAGLISMLFGFVCVRYTRIFFSILALALAQVLWSLMLKFYWFTGGTDGLRVPTPVLLGGLFPAAEDKTEFLGGPYYYYTLVAFFVAVAVMWLIVHSPFGKALQAIRDNETRAAFVGVQVRRYRWIAFVVSGAFTGLAGALWVPANGLITPDFLYWTFSGKIVFFAVLGGFRTFAGPIIGAVVFNYLEYLAVALTVYWQFWEGLILVVFVLALPTGIVGTVGRWGTRLRRAPA